MINYFNINKKIYVTAIIIVMLVSLYLNVSLSYLRDQSFMNLKNEFNVIFKHLVINDFPTENTIIQMFKYNANANSTDSLFHDIISCSPYGPYDVMQKDGYVIIESKGKNGLKESIIKFDDKINNISVENIGDDIILIGDFNKVKPERKMYYDINKYSYNIIKINFSELYISISGKTGSSLDI